MRLWVLSLALIGLSCHAFAAEEILTLKDGRVLTGDYDENTGVIVIYLTKGTAQVHVRPSEIASREFVAPPAPVETEEHRRVREQSAADQAAIDKRKAEVEAKLAEVQAQERAKQRADQEKLLAYERLAYWHRQGYTFDGGGLSAGEIDGLGARYQYADVLKERGYNLDPQKMTIEMMDAEVERIDQAKRDREQARIDAEQARIDAEEERQDRLRRDRDEREKAKQAAERQRQREADEAAQRKAERDYAEGLRQAAAEEAARRAASDREEVLAMFILIPIAIAVFVLPSVIARLRKHRNALAIGVLNLGIIIVPAIQFTVSSGYLGQTVVLSMNGIGALSWLGALIWSIIRTDRDEKRDAEARSGHPTRNPDGSVDPGNPSPYAAPSGDGSAAKSEKGEA